MHARLMSGHILEHKCDQVTSNKNSESQRAGESLSDDTVQEEEILLLFLLLRGVNVRQRSNLTRSPECVAASATYSPILTCDYVPVALPKAHCTLQPSHVHWLSDAATPVHLSLAYLCFL